MVRSRNHGISNLFSENHRKCLPGNFCLWDIDGLFINNDNQIIGIYEGKFKMESNDRGHFINTFNTRKNLQAGFLKKISDHIPVWICEESTQKWWELNNRLLTESSNPNHQLINTEDRIYIEEVLSGSYARNAIGVFLRTQGEKPSTLESYVNFISGKLEIKKILVNDIHEENSIFLKTSAKTIKIFLDESEDSSWTNNWKDLGIIYDLL
jgi:hypothetical protein